MNCSTSRRSSRARPAAHRFRSKFFPRCFVRSLQEKPASQLWWMANQAAFTIRKKGRGCLRRLRSFSLRPVRLWSWAASTFVPPVLKPAKQKGKIKRPGKSSDALRQHGAGSGCLPLLIFYFTIITAPAALFVAIRHWNSPSSIIPRTKIRFVVAIVIALVELAGWGVGVYFLIQQNVRSAVAPPTKNTNDCLAQEREGKV